jgi:MFS family permease
MMADIPETVPAHAPVVPDPAVPNPVAQNPAVHGAPGSFSRSALAATVGTTIEWYDFQVYGLAAALIFNAQFFPNFDPVAGTLLSFATFAVGFVARPIGAIIFGHMGDRVGRKSTLITTFLLTGIATLLVGLLPNYQTIDVFAPHLLVLLRLMQGIGLGGEWGGAVLIMTESGTQSRRGLLGSLPQLGSPAGLVIATLMFAGTTAAMTTAQFASWGWRLPFLLSIVLVVVGAFARISMPESSAFAQAKRSNTIATFPLLETLTTQWREVLLAAGLFLATSLGLPRELMLNGVLAFAIAELVIIAPVCAFSDRIGRRPVFITSALFTIAFAFPLFWLVNTKVSWLILLGMAIGGIANGVLFGIMGSFGPELFKTRVRYTGASLGYQLSAALGGGLTPLIATALVKWANGNYWPAPAWLAGLALVSLVAAILAPETRARSLSPEN